MTMQPKLPLLLDGATGTNLMLSGMPSGICVEQWILDHPEPLIELQRAFAEAGSRAVMAPTFGANRQNLSEFGLGDRVAEYNNRLVEISRRAVGKDVLVAGDISSTGLFVEPFGDVSFGELTQIFREQAFALKDAGADYIAIETMMNLTEARAALLASRETGLPVTVSLTVERGGKTLSGGDIAASLVTLAAMGASAVGVNCSTGPDIVLKALESAAPIIAVPLIAKPNAGLPREDGSGYDLTPEQFAQYAPAFINLGVGFIGGCCGTGPEHIRLLSAALAGSTYAPPAGSRCQEGALLAADERHVFKLRPDDIESVSEITGGPELEEELLSNAGGTKPVMISLSSMTDVEVFLQCAYLADFPLIFSAGDAGVLEAALAAYQGRALLASGCGVGSVALKTLSERYGAIVC